MTFKEFQKELTNIGIVYMVADEWHIRLPYKRDDFQKIIELCRKHLLTNWHIYYVEETENNPRPDVFMSWDRKQKEIKKAK